jgi:hypothetical protein
MVWLRRKCLEEVSPLPDRELAEPPTNGFLVNTML